MVLFAGHAAQKLYDPDANIEQSAFDYERARHLLQYVSESEEQLLSDADRLVNENWKHIEAVATALMEHETMEYDEWSIIIDAIDEGSEWREILERLLVYRDHSS